MSARIPNSRLLQIQTTLDTAVNLYNQPSFIPADPISIVHQMKTPQDREIMGLWTAVLAWGQRKTILNKAHELVDLMDGSPHSYIMHHKEKDLARMLHFRHRTFNDVDLLYFMSFFRYHYTRYESLEDAFLLGYHPDQPTTEQALNAFHQYFFSLDHAPDRTRKHIPAPFRKSSCKRLNMFLRWMVRQDDRGVDLGIWKGIRPDQLVIPLDVHVERVARRMGILKRKQRDWQAAVEITDFLRLLDPNDPVRYDFALFGIGVLEKPGP